MNTRPVHIPRPCLALMLAVALGGIAPSFALADSININPVKDNTLYEYVPTITPTPTPFTHPLLFPPVATDAHVSIGIDPGCVQILDGPCTNMWTYGGTYPGITIR